MTMSWMGKEITPIKMLLIASPKTMGDDSELRMAQIPTSTYKVVRTIAPIADWEK